VTEGVTAPAKLVSVVSLIIHAEMAKAICSMSTATLEIPSSSTQLYFSWNDEIEMSGNVAYQPAVVEPAVVVCDVEVKGAKKAAVASSIEVSHSGLRRAQPVKIGSLLLQLLKQYGITDAEIAAGIAAYEEKKSSAPCGLLR
jgi:hypothetical protein